MCDGCGFQGGRGWVTIEGPLTRGPDVACRFFKNANVECLCRLFSTMSHVEFKKQPCLMSLSFLTPCRMSLSLMSHVEFKKSPCRPVELRGLGPLIYRQSVSALQRRTELLQI